jgi:hypothetical protein
MFYGYRTGERQCIGATPDFYLHGIYAQRLDTLALAGQFEEAWNRCIKSTSLLLPGALDEKGYQSFLTSIWFRL